MNVAVAGALAAWTGRRARADEELLDVAMNIEAQVIGVPTGVQDYRPALYGGVSAVELGVAGVRRVALARRRCTSSSAGSSLAYTGASRKSGINNWDVMVRRINGDAEVVAAFDAIRDAALAMRDALERGDWTGRRAAAGRRMERPQAARAAASRPRRSTRCSSARTRAGALGRQGVRRRRRRVSRSASSTRIGKPR